MTGLCKLQSLLIIQVADKEAHVLLLSWGNASFLRFVSCLGCQEVWRKLLQVCESALCSEMHLLAYLVKSDGVIAFTSNKAGHICALPGAGGA